MPPASRPMPIHDWTRVPAGLFHAFHQQWTIALTNALNDGLLPPDFLALPEQRAGRPIPDVLAIRLPGGSGDLTGGTAVATARPRGRVSRAAADGFLGKANRVAVRTAAGEVVALIEIVSPGNKSSRAGFRQMVEKSADFVTRGVHLLVVDLFPPTPRDPHGPHAAIWEELGETAEPPPADQPLTVAAYEADDPPTAYVEHFAVGDELADLPIFLRPGWYVPAPLAATYATAWHHFPNALKPLLGDPG